MSCEKHTRHDLINHLRDQIAAGTYLTTGKLEAAARALAAAELTDDPDLADNWLEAVVALTRPRVVEGERRR